MQMKLGAQGKSWQDGTLTTDASVEIQNITGNTNITVCNKNICTKTALLNTKNIEFYFEPKLISKTFSISFTINTELNARSLYLKIDGKDASTPLVSTVTSVNGKVEQKITFTDEIYNEVKNGKTAYFLLYKSDANFTLPDDAQIENSETTTNYEPHQSQTFTFPFAENQRLMQGDKLADDGIHHKRKQVVLTGDENVGLNGESEGYYSFTIKDYASVIDVSNNTDILCNMLIANTGYVANIIRIASSGNIIILLDKTFCEYSITALKTKLKELYDAGTPMILEFTLLEEAIEAYTEEQQIAYNEIQKATTYKNVTHIFSKNELSPIFNVEYKKDIDIMFKNITNAILELGGTINV